VTTSTLPGRGASAGPASRAPRPLPGGSRFSRLGTPARLWILLAGAAAALLAFSALCAGTLAQRESTATHTTREVAGLVDNVQELYNVLADADATSATAILDGSAPPARFASRFDTDIAQAVNSIAAADQDLSGDRPDLTTLTELSQQLPAYTGLIGSADADNRLGYPLGAAYLREASGLMRTTMLPEVTRLLQHEEQAELSGLGSVGARPWWALAVLILAVAVEAFCWRHLARTTRRRINPGLALGALLGVALLGLILFSTAGAAGSAAAARSDFEQMNTTLNLRSDLATAESDQALDLISNGEDNGAAAADENKQLVAVSTAISSGSPERRLALTVLADSAHIRQLSGSGDYTGAVAATVGTGEQAGAGGFVKDLDTLDQALQTDASTQRATYDTAGARVVGDFSGGLWFALALGLLAALAAAAGINRRLAEYR
jgi:hypothetical protein